MNGERRLRLIHAVLIATFLFPSLCLAQADQDQSTSTAPEQEAQAPQPAALPVGPTALVGLQARSTPFGVVSSLGISLGYQFTDHVTFDIGLPIIYTRSRYSLVTTSDWQTDTLLGDPFLDGRYARKISGANVLSVVTVAFPASNPQRVYSTGRVGVDWFNHIQSAKPLKGFTPFLNAGAASKSIDRYYMPRPYSLSRLYESQGFISDFEGGLSYRIHHDYSVGASLYALVPAGSQKVFSKLITPDSAVVGDGYHGRVWDSAFKTIGGAEIDRDNGYSGWVEITRFKNVNFQFGYTHSVHYRYDSATIAVTFDGTSAIRELTGRTGR
jgi:hypothetical protein